MNNSIKILLGVIAALLIVGGALVFASINDVDDNSDDSNPSSDVNSTEDGNSTDDANSTSEDSDIVSEEIKYNYQNGGGYYREVTYKDGGFRQFDLETGELIGSSYASDQDKLPSME